MFECVCLGVVFALMIYLIRRKVDVSYALVAGAVALGLLFGVQWARLPRGLGASLVGIARNLGEAAIDRETLELAGLVLFIQFLGYALKHSAHLDRLMAALHPGGWELYDLEADRTELHDLAAANPDKVNELSALYDAWAKRSNVEPWPVRRPGAEKGGKAKKAQK